MYLFVRVLGPFYNGEVLPPFLVEQASHPCRASLSSLQSKLLILVEQASYPCRASFLKCGGQVWAFVLLGAHTKDGLYLLWACGHGPIGLANGPIGLAKPYFIFYPLQLPPSPHLIRRRRANGQLG